MEPARPDLKKAPLPRQEPDSAGGAEPIGWKPVVKAAILVLVIIGCLALMRQFSLDIYFDDPAWRRRMQESMGHWLPFLYVAAGSLLIALGFPRIGYSWLGGAFFGFLWGAVWGHVATMLGSTLCFWFARSLGREWTHRKFGEKFAGLERRLHDEGFAIMLLVRLCPIGNNFVTNCLAGASAMRPWPFFNASLIGHFPQTVFFALVGSGMIKGHHDQTLIGLAGFGLATLLFVFYFRRSQTARAVARELRGGWNGAFDKHRADS